MMALHCVTCLTTSANCDLLSLLMALGLEESYSGKFQALDDPSFVPFRTGSYPELRNLAFSPAHRMPALTDKDEVIGIVGRSCTKAYSLKAASWHHIIQDELDGRPILVTFCPLTYTAMVFDRMVDGQALEFQTDGLFDNNLVMVDRQTGSKWVQITGEAIEGAMQGKRMKLLPSLHSTWATWRELHPETLVLSHDTGFNHNYSEYPFGKSYLEYRTNWRILFPISHEDNRFHPKEVMLVLEVGNHAKAYPLAKLNDRGALNDVVDGQPILIVVDSERQLASVFSRVVDGRTLKFEMEELTQPTLKEQGSESRWSLEGVALSGLADHGDLTSIPAFRAYWFAWAAFHPDTLVEGESHE